MPLTIVDIAEPDKLDEAIAALTLPKGPIILLLGCFDPSLNEQVRSICSRVLAPISHDSSALVVDDAQMSGPALAFARAAVDQDETPYLLGIVPYGTAAEELEPTHSQILRLPKDWADTVKFKFQVLDKLLADTNMQGRAVALLFGGDDGHKRCLIRCARRNWPVIVLQNSGGLADKILNQATLKASDPAAATADPDLREILDTVRIYRSKIDGAVDELRNQILVSIDPRPQTAREILTLASRLFDKLDQAALRRQKVFRGIELALICMAVTAAVLAVLTTKLPWPPPHPGLHPNWDITALGLHLSVLVVPIALSIIGAYNSYFRDGIKWILLRGSAESLKREIYRFRTRTGSYADEQCQQTSREIKLAAKVKEIYTSLEQSEVNKQSITKANARGEANLPESRGDFMTSDRYVSERIRDQIEYFERKTGQLSRRLKRTQTWIYLAGGAGTFLAAINLDLWVAVATAFVAAFTSKLQADQVESTLVQYNQTLASLHAIECWWNALSPWEKNRANNRDVLVDQTERTLETETAGWVQQMQTALEKLTEKEPSNASK